MSDSSSSSSSSSTTPAMNDQLSKSTLIFGLHLWIIVGVCVGAAFVLLLFLISLWLTSSSNKRRSSTTATVAVVPSSAVNKQSSIPIVCKEIQIDSNPRTLAQDSSSSSSSKPSSKPNHESEQMLLHSQQQQHQQRQSHHDSKNSNGNHGSGSGNHGSGNHGNGNHRIHIEIGKDHRISYPEKYGGSSSHGSGEARSAEQVAIAVPEVSHLGWGHWYTLRELEAATNGFDHENVLGEGGYGIVYHGVFEDKSQVAVKNLLNNRGQAEREFKVEVETIGRVRHKNLVRLLGYCAEGAHRMLVYEYVNNGTLEQWLHGEVGPCSPLTWEIRMNIILGTAKGLTYLHEGLEPKVVHRDIKSSNILLDRQWNAKVSDFGLAKLLGSESSYITTRVMGTFGYVAPEYASTGMLNDRSDVYSFGILIMEIISGRTPVDYHRPSEEVNLVDWLKKMVSNRNPEGVLDPKMPQMPTSRQLKKTLLLALRCVDPNAQKRPKMGHIMHMLEAEESPFKDDHKTTKDVGSRKLQTPKDDLKTTESGDSSACYVVSHPTSQV